MTIGATRDTGVSQRAAFESAARAFQAGRVDEAVQALTNILGADPDEVNALRLLAHIEASRGSHDEATKLLTRAVGVAPEFHPALVDLVKLHTSAGRLHEAERLLRNRLATRPDFALYLMLGDLMIDLGDRGKAREAYRAATLNDPQRDAVTEGFVALGAGQGERAEIAFRKILQRNPNNIYALAGLATIALNVGKPDDAERLLKHGLVLSRNSEALWRGLSQAQMELGKFAEAESAARRVVEINPDNHDAWRMLGTTQAAALNPDEARRSFERAIALKADQPRAHLSLGHVLKTLGEREASERAYHQAASQDPLDGEIYWSLADLKNYRFTDSEIAHMERSVAASGVSPSKRANFHFALGKALEDRADFDRAFPHYLAGNRLKASIEPFDMDGFAQQCGRTTELVDRVFMRERQSALRGAPVPIFIVGLPRSGSTLVEQILSSHSRVRATMELQNIPAYVREMKAGGAYPDCLGEMTAAAALALGRRYLDETRRHHGDAPWFTDKLPNNFAHIGLIAMLLPDAIFIDVRREPMDCGLSCFRQSFARGQAFTYKLETLGQCYRHYLHLMSHWERSVDNRLLRVHYEDLILRPEETICALLSRCGLAFEDRCLRFYENKRAVQTASAEQVRQPIYRHGLGHWRKFEKWLQPLAAALGDAVERYREPPSNP